MMMSAKQEGKASPAPKRDSNHAAVPCFKVIDRVMKRHQFQQDALIEVLATAQEAYGLLTEEVLTHVARCLKLPPSWVYGVATFYHFFSLASKGRHHCVICTGTACYVGGAQEIQSALEDRFGIASGNTTDDGCLTLSTARCVGSCGLAPVAVVDGELLGRQSPQSLVATLEHVIQDDVGETDAQAGNAVPYGGGS